MAVFDTPATPEVTIVCQLPGDLVGTGPFRLQLTVGALAVEDPWWVSVQAAPLREDM